MIDKKKLMLGVAALVPLSSFAVDNEANAVTQAVTMTAAIIAPVALATVQGLKFSNFTMAAAATGKIIMSAAGVRSAAGAATMVGGAGAGQQGIIKITAAEGPILDIKIAAADTVKTAGTKTMGVGLWVLQGLATQGFTANTTNVAADIAAISGALATATANTGKVNIGATLKAAVNQVAGSYTGSFDVVVNYQ